MICDCLLCVSSPSPKKSSKKSKPTPKKEDSGKYKSAEFVESDDSSSEDEKPLKRKEVHAFYTHQHNLMCLAL